MEVSVPLLKRIACLAVMEGCDSQFLLVFTPIFCILTATDHGSLADDCNKIHVPY